MSCYNHDMLRMPYTIDEISGDILSSSLLFSVSLTSDPCVFFTVHAFSVLAFSVQLPTELRIKILRSNIKNIHIKNLKVHCRCQSRNFVKTKGSNINDIAVNGR